MVLDMTDFKKVSFVIHLSFLPCCSRLVRFCLAQGFVLASTKESRTHAVGNFAFGAMSHILLSYVNRFVSYVYDFSLCRLTFYVFKSISLISFSFSFRYIFSFMLYLYYFLSVSSFVSYQNPTIY